MAISMLNSTILFTVMGVICQMRKLLQAETEDWMKVAKKNLNSVKSSKTFDAMPY